eukprot:gene5889-9717_t
MSNKKVLAVDVDEVICHFVPHLIDFHNEKYETDMVVDTFHNYSFHKVWGGTPEEASAKVEDFFQSDHFKNLLPIKGAYEQLQELKQDFKLVIVTSRQHQLREDTESFIQKYYPDTFDEMLFGNHYGKVGKKMTKSEMCKSIGAELLIDDNLHYANDCATNGIKAILFGKYAWNQYDDELHENIHHVHHWDDVSDAIKKLLE